MAQAPALPRGFELPLEPRLPRIGSVDAVALEERAATLAKRSIKKESKLQAFELAVRMMDLTTLEGADTPGKVAALCSKAIRPDPVDRSVPSVAAICVYPNLVPTAKQRLEGSGVKVASVATYFPSGQAPLDVKVTEVRDVVALGADEVDMVIDRGAFLSGRYAKVYDEIVRIKEACGDVHLKVILETGELGTYDNVRRASLLAMAAGADFIKTSTGKVNPAATLPVTLCMLEAIRDVHEETGRVVGMKPAAGARPAEEARAWPSCCCSPMPWLPRPRCSPPSRCCRTTCGCCRPSPQRWSTPPPLTPSSSTGAASSPPPARSAAWCGPPASPAR